MSLFTMQLARKGKPVQIQTRTIDDSFESKETSGFTTVHSAKAIICTPKGKKVIDGVGIEFDVTHEFNMTWPGFDITIEHWVYFTAKNKRYRILNAKNCCEEDERMVLQCTERGLDTREATGA